MFYTGWWLAAIPALSSGGGGGGGGVTLKTSGFKDRALYNDRGTEVGDVRVKGAIWTPLFLDGQKNKRNELERAFCPIWPIVNYWGGSEIQTPRLGCQQRIPAPTVCHKTETKFVKYISLVKDMKKFWTDGQDGDKKKYHKVRTGTGKFAIQSWFVDQDRKQFPFRDKVFTETGNGSTKCWPVWTKTGKSTIMI